MKIPYIKTKGTILLWIFSCSYFLYSNVLQNPGFEDGLNYWQMTSGTSSIISVPTGVRNGYFAMLTPDAGVVGFRQTSIPVQPNTWYRLTVHSKVKELYDLVSSYMYPICWSKFYVNGEEIYNSWHNWYSFKWLQDDWTVFNTGGNTSIEITIERYVETFFFDTEGIVFDDIILAPYDTIQPKILSAEASDGTNQIAGIDDDDYVVIAFSEPTNKIPIQRYFETVYEEITHPLDIACKLLSGNTWLDGTGNIKEALWNENGDTMVVYLSTNSGAPTIVVGDTIRPGRSEILDESGNPILRDVVVLAGSFGGGGVAENMISKQFNLQQNLPNPFNSTTSIRYQLSKDGYVRLNIYDICGRFVTNLVNEHQKADFYDVCWNGKNELGNECPSGIFFYKLEAGDLIAIRKMIRLERQ